jgi:hypothetical protein
MKSLLLVSLLALSTHVMADQHEKEMNVEEVKQKMLTHIDKRISAMQEHRSCVSSAKDKEALKACRNKMKSHRDAMKEEHMKMRGEMKGKKDKKEKKGKKK